MKLTEGRIAVACGLILALGIIALTLPDVLWPWLVVAVVVGGLLAKVSSLLDDVARADRRVAELEDELAAERRRPRRLMTPERDPG